MKTCSINYSTLVKTTAMAGLLFLALGYTSNADAAGGCGFGFHRGYYGRCLLNHPGPWATPAPRHRGCWRNHWGQLRCYR